MKKLALLLALGFLLQACVEESTEVIISANVKGANEVIVYEVLPEEIIAIDTVKIEDGKFKIGKELDTAGFYTFVFPETRNKVPLFLQPGEKIDIDIDATTNYPIFHVKGSEGSKKMQRQWESYTKTFELIDSLDVVSRTYVNDSMTVPEPVYKRLRFIYFKRIQDHRNEILSLIDEDTTDLTNVNAINQMIGKSRILSIAEFGDYYKKIDNGLQSAHPNHRYAKAFHQQYQKELLNYQNQMALQQAQNQTEVGAIAPDIALQDPEGQMRKLSDLRGKVVLIDFWASWCVPCRQSNPTLVNIYQAYKDKGFDIFSVSLDGVKRQSNAKKEWTDAITKDNLEWPNHVSDLLGWESATQKLYGFTGIPHTVLIDKEGVIIAKNLHGEALRNALNELL